jgi:hypothetical protein
LRKLLSKNFDGKGKIDREREREREGLGGKKNNFTLSFSSQSKLFSKGVEFLMPWQNGSRAFESQRQDFRQR